MTTPAPAGANPTSTPSRTCPCSATSPRRCRGRVHSTGTPPSSSLRSPPSGGQAGPRSRHRRGQRRADGADRLRTPHPDRRDARPRRHRLRGAVGQARTRHPRRVGAAHPRGLPTAVHRAGRLARPARRRRPRRRRHRRRAPSRPDDGDDGRAQPDDGAGDDGHVDRLDGRPTRPAGVRPVRPADPPHVEHACSWCRAPSTSSPTSGACRSTRCGCGCWPRSSSATRCTRMTPTRDAITSLVQRHVGAFRADPSSVSEKLRRPRPRRRRPDERASRRRFADPEVLLGAVRSPEQVADGTGARRVDRRGRRLRRLHGRRGRRPAHRRRRAAHRRGRAPSPHRGRAPRTCSSSDSSACRSRLRRCSGARTSSPVWSIVPASRRCPDCSPPPTSLPTPAELDAPGLWLARIEL